LRWNTGRLATAAVKTGFSGRDESLPQTIRVALGQVTRDMLKAETEKENGSLVHKVEVVTPAKSIVEFTIDANVGAILKQSVDPLDDGNEGEHEEDEDED
jgi:hypothetical protein